MVCVPKENYVPVSKPDERIIIDVSYQDDDFDMVNTSEDYEASFDEDAFKKANVGDVFTMGKIAGEDVEWRVLDVDSSDGSKFVISKDVIDVKSARELEGIFFMKCVAWKDSKIRNWLNNKFMEALIPSEVQRKIKETQIINKRYVGNMNTTLLEYEEQNNTLDKIYLLSTEEAEKYFANDADRMAYATNYTWNRVKPYLYRHTKNEKTGGVKWWLRDCNKTVAGACYNVVDGDGSISDYILYSSAHGVGVRPAMWIKL